MRVNKQKLSPEYPRIPHLRGLSRLYDDDVEVDVELGFDAYVQEKVDGANCGMSWCDGPILRNRKHILKKGFMKDTPAKKQFVPAWNYLHEREDDLRELIKEWQCPVTLYGEWMLAKHSLKYDLLPDYFLVYDIWSSEERKFISPWSCEELLEGTKFHWIKAEQTQLDLSGLRQVLDAPSAYRTGMREGVVIKKTDPEDLWITEAFKVVRDDFERAGEDWNDRPLEKNVIKP